MLRAIRDRLPPDEVRQVEDKLGAHPLSILEGSLITEWLPARHQVALDQAVHEVIGDERIVQFHEHYVHQSAPRMLGSFARSVTNLFGEGPRILARAMPKAWSFVTRDLGEVETSTVDNAPRPTVRVRYVNLPPLLRNRTFELISRGGQMGVLAFAGGKGIVTTDGTELERGIVTHEIEFTT